VAHGPKKERLDFGGNADHVTLESGLGCGHGDAGRWKNRHSSQHWACFVCGISGLCGDMRSSVCRSSFYCYAPAQGALSDDDV